jgi:hypothetical protein
MDEQVLLELKFRVGELLRQKGLSWTKEFSAKDAANDVIRTAIDDPKSRMLLRLLVLGKTDRCDNPDNQLES